MEKKESRPWYRGGNILLNLIIAFFVIKTILNIILYLIFEPELEISIIGLVLFMNAKTLLFFFIGWVIANTLFRYFSMRLKNFIKKYGVLVILIAAAPSALYFAFKLPEIIEGAKMFPITTAISLSWWVSVFLLIVYLIFFRNLKL